MFPKTTEWTEAKLWYVDKKSSSVFNNFLPSIQPFVDTLQPDTVDLPKTIDIRGRLQKDYEHGNAYTALKSRVTKGAKQLKNYTEIAVNSN